MKKVFARVGSSRRRLWLLLGLVIGVAVAAGAAFGTIPGSDGLINGCFAKRTGLLRVIDAEAGNSCGSTETAISWNERGVKGDPGPKGEPGPKGDPGPPGTIGSIDALAGTRCTTVEGNVGELALSRFRVAVNLGCVAPDRFESNDSRSATAQVAFCGGLPCLTDATIYPSGDEDWFGHSGAARTIQVASTFAPVQFEIFRDGERVATGETTPFVGNPGALLHRFGTGTGDEVHDWELHVWGTGPAAYTVNAFPFEISS